MSYSFVLMSPWQWRFIAETCRRIHVYGWVVILYKLRPLLCRCLITTTVQEMKNIKFTYVSTSIRHWYAHMNPIIHILCNKWLFISVLANRFTVAWSAVKIVACYRMVKNIPITVLLQILPLDSSSCLIHFWSSALHIQLQSMYKNFHNFSQQQPMTS